MERYHSVPKEHYPPLYGGGLFSNCSSVLTLQYITRRFPADRRTVATWNVKNRHTSGTCNSQHSYLLLNRPKEDSRTGTYALLLGDDHHHRW